MLSSVLHMKKVLFGGNLVASTLYLIFWLFTTPVLSRRYDDSCLQNSKLSNICTCHFGSCCRIEINFIFIKIICYIWCFINLHIFLFLFFHRWILIISHLILKQEHSLDWLYLKREMMQWLIRNSLKTLFLKIKL